MFNYHPDIDFEFYVVNFLNKSKDSFVPAGQISLASWKILLIQIHHLLSNES
jgi:hypothetical protein